MPHASIDLFSSSQSRPGIRNRLHWIEVLIALLFLASLLIGFGSSTHVSVHKKRTHSEGKQTSKIIASKQSDKNGINASRNTRTEVPGVASQVLDSKDI